MYFLRLCVVNSQHASVTFLSSVACKKAFWHRTVFFCRLILKVVGFTPFAILSLLTVFVIPATPDTASLNVSGIRLSPLGKHNQSR